MKDDEAHIWVFFGTVAILLWMLWMVSNAAEMDFEDMHHWVLVSEEVDIHNGDVVKETPIRDFDALYECSKSQIARVERPHDGVVTVYVCRHDLSETST